jgi:hypothetical protein
VVSGSGRAGAPQLCQTSFSSWAGVGPSASLFSFDGYRWVRDGAQITGQSGQTYVPSSGDVGHQLACSATVTYALPFLVTASASSLAITVQPPVSAPGPTPPVPAPAPVLSELKLSPSRFSLAGRRVNGHCVKPTAKNKRRLACTRQVTLSIRYTLNTATTVSFRIDGSVPGRKVAGRCVTQTSKNSKQKKCTRRITLRGSIAQAGKAGTNSLVLARKLGPGSYTLAVTPTGGVPRHVTFKIVP